MSPTPNPYVATQLRQLIYYHLDNDFVQNALFLAGRLHGQEPRSPDAAHLLALCNLRLGRLKAAYDYSREKGFRGHHLGCAYVFAQACLGLGRYPEGITALDRARGQWGGRNHWNKHSETARRHLPDAAAVNCLLGKLWRAHGDVNKAIACYAEALKLNPFMWDAFLDLCETGAVVRPSNVFKMTPEMSALLSASTAFPDSPPANASSNGIFTPSQDLFNPGRTENGQRNGGGLFARFIAANGNGQQVLDVETPRETPWVLAQMGRAQYEQARYSEAADLFEKVKRIAPSRMEDMEVYSTVLWHLKGETDLAYLAHELIETDRLSPQAWCAIGNSFSLQREHDQAVKCFRRATQLDPKFAYAFTLQGHEHVANEEFDKALLAYRSAIAADSRHYNGWYGLGRVYEKMGKFEVAEKHYKNAHHINPRNPVLLVCIGVVLERMRKPQAALLQYNEACRLDPRSALARFKKARVLMNLRKTRMALEELEILKDLAPDEANVHFMLGKLYKMMRDKTSAIRHFTIALNLDPKAAQYIKEAMESLEDDEDDEYDDDDDGA
ncbi:Protein bimA [Lasiodiplodia theobromae]|uniref:Protein bimA n=1 Tax=Lasiodiplodia theobromae TaxID=45133 RepID=A0A5N5DKR1_9PEZI|nr:Protein bimA [Lasiodiplodia theobromae]